jgi:hypothetical protein
MQRRAIEILGALGSPGPNGEVAQALDQIVRDEKSTNLRMRCTAADALGRLEFPSSDPGLDLDKTARGLGTITISVCRTHGDRLKDRLQERDMGGGYGGASGYGYGGAGRGVAGPSSGYPYPKGAGATSRDGGYGRGGRGSASSGYPYGPPPRGRKGGTANDGGYGFGATPYGDATSLEEPEIPEDPLLTEARRAVKHQLGCVKNGLAGAERATPGHDTVKELKQVVDELLTSLDKEELTVDQFLEAIDERASQLLETAFGIPGPDSRPKAGEPAEQPEAPPGQPGAPPERPADVPA